MSAPVRVVVGEDDVLMRRGVVRVLEEAGFEVVAQAGDADGFLRKALAHRPDVAVRRVAEGGSALDPEVVGRMLGRRRAAGPLDELSTRDREVLALMAQGLSNRGIAQALFVTSAAVEKHVTSIFTKLELPAEPTAHRRVLAALTYLQNCSEQP
jgi:DNA-binding NarL/FixJ family response regulator